MYLKLCQQITHVCFTILTLILIVFTDYQIDQDTYFSNYEGRPDYNDYISYEYDTHYEEMLPVHTTSTPAADLQVEVSMTQDGSGRLVCSVQWSSVAGADYVVGWKREECHSQSGCDGPNGPWAAVSESLTEVGMVP